MKVITKTAELVFDKRGFLRINFLNNNEEFDLEEAKQQILAGEKLLHSKKSPVLVDVRDSFHVPTKEAKNYLAKFKLKTAEAILTKSLAHLVIGNFYSKLVGKANKNCPVKIFKDEDLAIKWLLDQNKIIKI